MIDSLRAENYIMRQTLLYLAKRESRAGEWIKEWGPGAATAALAVIDDPKLLAKFTEGEIGTK
jgi:hypothetical protein